VLKAKIFSTTNVNSLTSTKEIIIILANLVLKKDIILFLLVNNCILMYLETTTLSIYKFLILYGCLFGVFFFFFILWPPLA